MIFLQGTRDTLADQPVVTTTVDALGALAPLKLIGGADHLFHVLTRSARTDTEAMTEMLDAFAEWAEAIVGG